MSIRDRRGASVDATDPAAANDPNPGLAVKTAALVATTANITLVGLQTIDGVVTAERDRVLVKNQTDPTQNGLYSASSGNWTRTRDFSSNTAVARGLRVFVNSGTQQETEWVITSPDPILIGTSTITFALVFAALAATNAGAPGGRLTTVPGVSLPITDQVGANAVNYSAHGDGPSVVSLWNGVTIVNIPFTSDLRVALDNDPTHPNYNQGGKLYDFYAFLLSGTTLAIGTSPLWDAGTDGSATQRGTGAGSTELLIHSSGLRVNKNIITLRIGNAQADTVSVPANQARYLGTGRMVLNGLIEDSLAKRFLWNAHNQVIRPMQALESTDFWEYTLAQIRQANGNAANQLDFVLGLAGMSVRADVYAMVSNTGAAGVQVMIGLDATDTMAPGCIAPYYEVEGANFVVNPEAHWRGFPGIGHHVLTWEEFSAATGTSRWYGDNGAPTRKQSGIMGELFG